MAGTKKKTHKGLKKRIKITGTGKVRTHKVNGSHLLSHKSAKRRRRLRGSQTLEHAIAKTMKRVMEV